MKTSSSGTTLPSRCPACDEVAGVDQAVGEGAVDRRAHRGEIEIALGLGQRGLQFGKLRAGFVLLRLGDLDIVARRVIGRLRRPSPPPTPWSRPASDTSKVAREAKPLVLSACWRSKSRPARFRPASAEASCALACSTALSMRGDLAADPVDGGLLGRDPGARGIDRDAIVAVVDPEDHVAGLHHDVVAGQDRRDVAGHPRAERGVVGAHIGVVGGDEEAADQNIMHAVAAAASASSAPTPIRTNLRLPDFGAAAVGSGLPARPACRWPACRASRRAAGDGLVRDMSAKLRRETRTVARDLAFGRIRLGTKDARGLVSRCGHHGLPNHNVATQAQPKHGLAASLAFEINIDRTVRSRYIQPVTP